MNQNSIKYLIDGQIDNNSLNFKLFDDYIVDFFDCLSKLIMKDEKSKLFPDLITFAFFIRKANISILKDRYIMSFDNVIKKGRGIVFHIAPSNVPMNFAYSLFAGLICGNKNIIKVSSKEFEQVDILCNKIIEALKKYDKLKEYISIVRYSNDKEINDYFSLTCDVRVIWGGDNTIDLIRQSKLKPRAREIAFSDRYSLLVVDANYYKKLSNDDKVGIAHSVYNDTYLTDQNACTSPRLICFIGNENVKDEFYSLLENEVKERYNYQPIFSTNKLLIANEFAIEYSNLNPKIIYHNNSNYIIRIYIDKINERIVKFSGNSGLFVECDINSIKDIIMLCRNDSVQTISYIGDKSMFNSLLNCDFVGVDRIVPIGKTMDFSLIWDGYNLVEMLSRNIEIR